MRATGHAAPAAPTRLQALEHEVARLRDAVAALERARGPRDDHEAAVLVALARIVDGATFTAADVHDRGALDPDFRRHLHRADLYDARAIGYLLRQARGHVFAGRRLERAAERHAWRFVAVSDGSGIGRAW